MTKHSCRDVSTNILQQQYQRSERRLFILDYEGTLVSWGPVNKIIPVSPQVGYSPLSRVCDSAADRPSEPSMSLSDLLLDERNTIYVMSGRRHEELDRLFRRVPKIGLIAENGCFLKHPGGSAWKEIADVDQIRSWKESVKRILEYYVERTPGAEIEERRCSLAFHYKSAEDYKSAAVSASNCASHINDDCVEQRVHATPMGRFNHRRAYRTGLRAQQPSWSSTIYGTVRFLTGSKRSQWISLWLWGMAEMTKRSSNGPMV